MPLVFSLKSWRQGLKTKKKTHEVGVAMAQITVEILELTLRLNPISFFLLFVLCGQYSFTFIQLSNYSIASHSLLQPCFLLDHFSFCLKESWPTPHPQPTPDLNHVCDLHHSNTRFLIHRAGPGIKPASSRILVTMGTPTNSIFVFTAGLIVTLSISFCQKNHLFIFIIERISQVL